MPPTRVIVWREGEWLPSKNGDGMNKHVIFKTIPKEGDTPKEVRLNITDYESFFNGQSIKDIWEPLCKEGNVLVVAMLNNRNINKFNQPSLERAATREGGQDAGQ